MKNLKLLKAYHTTVTENCECFCIDLDSNNVYFGSKDSIYCFEDSSKTISKCADLTGEIEVSESSHVVGMEYLIISQTIFLALSSGDIFVYDLYRREVECVGTVDSGLKSLAWSPDQEFLVLLTGENTLILMTKEFDPIAERNLLTDEFGEQTPITVGWGSKETQFHGSEGKNAAKVQTIEPKATLATDDGKFRISWRGDGDFFVTSIINPDKGYRKLQIWSRDAKLQCTAEAKDGLEQALCWRPSGNLIACTQQHMNKHKVIFFEKNGLQHGEFVLPFEPNTCKVTDLLWNVDSTVLAILAEDATNSDNPIAQIMLWTSSNYHWYLKQRLQFADTQISSFFVHWDRESPYELHIYRKTGDYMKYTWAWAIYNSIGNTEDNDSIVSSIDNCDVLITPFRKTIVPPPLCAYSFSVTQSIDAICFSSGMLHRIGIYLSDQQLVILQKDNSLADKPLLDTCKLKLVAAGGNGFVCQVQPYTPFGIYSMKLEADFKPLAFCHWTWVNDEKLLCICYSYNDKRTCYLLSVNIPTEYSSENSCLDIKCCKTVTESVIGMCTNASGTTVALQLCNGKVMKYNFEELTPWLCDEKDLTFPQPCSQMSILSVQGKDYVLGLTDRFVLYCNDIIILPNCTSYSIHDEFLLATTIDQTLKCFLINWDILAVVRNKLISLVDIPSQKIEKGAKIVTTTPGDTKVVLQMPRGNLEVIHPRPLVLSTVLKCLDRMQYSKAFEISKLHRIDMNLLHDHNPLQFMDNIDSIVNQIDNPADVNIFLTNLLHEDVTTTMYSSAYRDTIRQNEIVNDNKVDSICDAFRSVLEAKNDYKYFPTVMATYAKKRQPELDKALIKIKSVKDSDELPAKDAEKVVDDALKFLLYLVDVHELFNVALGTYDFEIAIMVAQKSQKDPKEFLPFFNDLQKFEENYRKYKIDMHLQRYKQALMNISKSEEHFNECVLLIKDQRLYVDALYLFPPSTEQYKIVWREYGNYLMEKRYFDEAGLVFTKCGEHEKALLAYKECSNWQLVLCSAEHINYSDEKIISLCQQMSEKLIENQRYKEASFLLEHYVKDVEESIVALIEGCEWNSALLLISKYRRHDITETHFKPALIAHRSSLASYFNQLSSDFCTYTDRLKVVRSQKRQQCGMPDLVRTTDDDLFSETSSVSNLSSVCESRQLSGSIMTRKSSKSKRKQKLKQYRLKEGSPNEDLALIAQLSEIVSKVDNLKDNFLSTLQTLVRFGLDDDARSVQQQMIQIIEKIELEIPNIWCRQQNEVSEMTFGPDATSNSIAAKMQAQKDTPVIEIDPELAPPTWRKNFEFSLQIFK